MPGSKGRRIATLVVGSLVGVAGLGSAVLHREPVVVRRDTRHMHEESDASAFGVVAAGVSLLVMLAVTLLVVSALYGWFTERPVRVVSPYGVGAERAPGNVPGTKPAPGALPPDLMAFRRAQERTLATYGWVDERAGIVHVPIDRAVDMVLARGLPARTLNDASRQRTAGASASGRWVEGPRR